MICSLKTDKEEEIHSNSGDSKKVGDDIEITNGKERHRTHDELFCGKLKLSFKI